MSDQSSCLRCGRPADDLIHDNPNDHGWTGTKAMHPFVDERGKRLLEWTMRNVELQAKTGKGKSRYISPETERWNEAIDAAAQAVVAMARVFTPEELTEHDRYFANASASPEPRTP